MAKKAGPITDEESKNLCEGCTLCCSHVTVEIDKPETKEDIQEVIWFIIHKNTMVFIDEDNDWFIEFRTPCDCLDENGLCTIYNERPAICRKYNQDECERYGDGDYYTHVFKTREDFLKYIEVTPRLKKIMEEPDDSDEKED